MFISVATADLPLPDRVTLESVPSGAAGTRRTLELMRRMIRAARANPVIRNLAVFIVAAVPRGDVIGQAAAVQQWVRTNIRYVKDPRNLETLTEPQYTVSLRAGDCDDHSMLVASLLECIGLRTRLIAVGPARNHFSHVLAQVFIKAENRWAAVETTEPWGVGQMPNFPARMMLET